MTRLFGVIGWPVEHSRSPRIHQAALQELGLDASYVKLPVRPGELAVGLRELRDRGLAGANVTLPHKETIATLLDEVEPVARAIGAVNTLVRDGNRLIGANTDAGGLVRSLRENDVELEGRTVWVLGAGGAARAAVFGLIEAGAIVHVTARRADRAADLARSFGASDFVPDTHNVDLVIQATSATLNDTPQAQEFVASLPIADLPRAAVVVDLVYAPLETALLRAASARGLRTLDGLGMLVAQAALSFERWWGRPAPIEAMRAAAHIRSM